MNSVGAYFSPAMLQAVPPVTPMNQPVQKTGTGSLDFKSPTTWVIGLGALSLLYVLHKGRKRR